MQGYVKDAFYALNDQQQDRHSAVTSKISRAFEELYTMLLMNMDILKATPHKARLTAWRRICLHIFRHIA